MSQSRCQCENVLLLLTRRRPPPSSPSAFSYPFTVSCFIYRDTSTTNILNLHVEYAGRSRKYGILCISDLLCEYINLEYVRVPVIYRVNQAECVIHSPVAALQEYVNTYSTRRTEIRARANILTPPLPRT